MNIHNICSKNIVSFLAVNSELALMTLHVMWWD